jgi:hypothetical protein
MGTASHKIYINEYEVSKITGRAVQTLRNDRHKRRGIPYYKLGRSVRYLAEEVYSFVERHRIEHANNF